MKYETWLAQHSMVVVIPFWKWCIIEHPCFFWTQHLQISVRDDIELGFRKEIVLKMAEEMDLISNTDIINTTLYGILLERICHNLWLV